MKLFGVVASAVQKAYGIVTDTFNRSDSTSLGTAPGGQQWVNVRGAWAIVSNKARGVAADKPISTLTFTSTDLAVLVDGIGPGCGTAFWVTDSGNWWGAYLDQTVTYSSCQGGGNCAGTSPCCSSWTYTSAYYYYYVYYQVGGAGNTAPCSSCGIYTYCGTNCKKVSIKEYAPSSYTCTGGYNAQCCSSYNAVYYYDCSPVTTRKIKIIQSVSGTITDLATKSVTGAIVGIKTILSGSTISVKAYTGAGYTSETADGDTTYTASSPTKTKKHGILLMPASNSQATDIDEFKVV